MSDITQDRKALQAIVARIQGEYDNPALLEYGPLSTSSTEDVLHIAAKALARNPVAELVKAAQDLLEEIDAYLDYHDDEDMQEDAERLRNLLYTDEAAMATDIAWEKGDGKTNYRLKDGDRVELKYATIVDDQKGTTAEPGERGTVVQARSPKVAQKPGTSPWFANVNMDNGDRIRVPHGALKKVRR